MRELDAVELQEWALLEEIEPWGERQANWRMGMVASVIANAHRDAKRRPAPFGVDDFLRPEPLPPDEVEAQRLATLMARAEQWTQVFQARP